MNEYLVALNFPSDLRHLGVVGTAPLQLPDTHPCIPSFGDHIFFPEELSYRDGTPAVFIIARRWFVSLPAGVMRCDLELALATDIKMPPWERVG